MKYIHTTVLFVALLLTLASCSSDVEKEDGILIEMSEDGVIVTTTLDGVTTVHEERTGLSQPGQPEAKPEPQPDWTDNVITITVDNFATKEDMVSKFQRLRQGGMKVCGSLENWAIIPEHKRGREWEELRITPPEDAYTVDITLISFQGAGFKKPATIIEVREKLIAMGLEPVTVEEAHEIRLQLKDQPSHGPWSKFLTLPVEEEIRRLYNGKEASYVIYNRGKKYGIGDYIYQAPGPGAKNDELIIPSEEFREQSPRGLTNPWFACTIPESRRKK